MKSDNFIIVTGSRNLGDDEKIETENTNIEGDDSSRRVLEEHGIFLEQENNDPLGAEASHEEFSKKLQEIGGIEIIKSEDEDINY